MSTKTCDMYIKHIKKALTAQACLLIWVSHVTVTSLTMKTDEEENALSRSVS